MMKILAKNEEHCNVKLFYRKIMETVLEDV